MKFEVCANSVESCVKAQKGGADRVELCAAISDGGTTPSFGEIMVARELLNIKLHIIIRPRGGDFLYSELEGDIMERDIRMARNVGADGVVFGCLSKDGRIDLPLMQRLMRAAEGLSFTFHRAFDLCADPFEALEQLIELGVHRLLTSGQQPKAEQGIDLLKELNRRANGRIIIMPGSGINETNIARIARETGCREFHFSARKPIESRMEYRPTAVPMSTTGQDEYIRQVTSAERVRQTIAAARAAGV